MTPIINEGYSIIDSINIQNNTFVLGHHPTAPAAYVTWAQQGSDFFYGHYFTTLENARVDLLQRGIECLSAKENHMLTETLLTEDIRNEIRSQMRDEEKLEDIRYALEDAMDHLGISMDSIEQLMNNEDFKAQALHLAWNIDHSAENEALKDNLETLIDEHFSEHLPREFSTFLKISPEELLLQNDILSLTAEEVEQKYGPFEEGEGLLHFSKLIRSTTSSVVMELYISPKETAEGENRITVSVFPPNRTDQPTELIMKGVTNLEQIYQITDNKGITWKLDLHADERLRRIGREYNFFTDASDSPVADYNGKTCTILRMLTPAENDLLYSRIMWKAAFHDGKIIDVFDDELSPTKEISWDLSIHPEQIKPEAGEGEKKALKDIIEKARNESNHRGYLENIILSAHQR